MEPRDGVSAETDREAEDFDTLVARWRAGRPAGVRVADGSCAPSPTADEAKRVEWGRMVDRFLASPLANGIPKRHVVALLSGDDLGDWTEEIERWGEATIVTPMPSYDEDGYIIDNDLTPDTDPVVIVLRRNEREDPIAKTIEADFAYCQVGASYLAGDLAAAGLGVCEYVYWATDTDDPAGFDMRVEWPLGHKPGDAEDNSRVSLHGADGEAVTRALLRPSD